jgi:hypothetical protein
MRTLLNYSLILLNLFIGFGVRAQDVKSDLVKINAVYDKPELAFSVNYRLYKHADDPAPANEKEIYVAKYGKQTYRQDAAGVETISDTDYMLTVNHADKRITLAKNTINVAFSGDVLQPEKIAKLVASAREVTYKKNGKESVYTFRFDPASSTYNEISLVFNSKNYSVHEIHMLVSAKYGGGKVVLQLSEPVVKKIKRKTVNDFLWVQDGTFVPQEAYASYKFFNLYSKTNN